LPGKEGFDDLCGKNIPTGRLFGLRKFDLIQSLAIEVQSCMKSLQKSLFLLSKNRVKAKLRHHFDSRPLTSIVPYTNPTIRSEDLLRLKGSEIERPRQVQQTETTGPFSRAREN